MDNSSKFIRHIIFIHGLDKDVEYVPLKRLFSRFGPVTKLYVNNNEDLAKVYFNTRLEIEEAFNVISKSHPHWKLALHSGKDEFPTTPQGHRTPSVSELGSAGDMANMEDFENVEENFDYVDVHGRNLVVLKSDTGDIFVPLREIRKTGFAIYRKDNYDTFLADNEQIKQEFRLHLLSEAKNYLLKNKVTAINEEQIVNTIKRCENLLLNSSNTTTGLNDYFTKRRSVSAINNSIQITSQVNSPMPTSNTTNHRNHRQQQNNFSPSNRKNDNSKKINNDLMKKEQKELRNSDATSSFNSSPPSNQMRKPKDMQMPSISENFVINQFELELGDHEVVVDAHEKDKIYWVHLKKNNSVVDDLLLKLSEASNLQKIQPTVGRICVAQYEGIWCRAKIINIAPVTVQFIDYGNISQVETVKNLPEELKKIPAQAIRVVLFEKNAQLNLEAVVNVKFQKKFDDGRTYLVSLSAENGKIEPTPTPQTSASKTVKTDNIFLNDIKSSYKIANGDKVIIIDFQDDHFFLRTREFFIKYNNIVEHIKELDKSGFTSVKMNQLVLCSKDGLTGLFRAVVTKIDGSIIDVKYIDHPGEYTLSLKSLRNVDEFLANEPGTFVESPPFKNLNKAGEKSIEYLLTLIEKKSKLIVVLRNELIDFQLEGEFLLSEVIRQLDAPPESEKPIVEEVVVKKSVEVEEKPLRVEDLKMVEQRVKLIKAKPKSNPAAKIFIEQMQFMEVPVGDGIFMIASFKDFEEITLITMDDENAFEWMQDLTAMDVTDTTPYTPEQYEMCLALYKDENEEDASWYRSVVTEVEGDVYEIQFVDYGNVEKIKSKELRRFPEHLKKIPILGLTCELVDLPKNAATLKSLKEWIVDGMTEKISIKKIEENELCKYKITIPSLYKKLESDGLLN